MDNISISSLITRRHGPRCNVIFALGPLHFEYKITFFPSTFTSRLLSFSLKLHVMAHRFRLRLLQQRASHSKLVADARFSQGANSMVRYRESPNASWELVGIVTSTPVTTSCLVLPFEPLEFAPLKQWRAYLVPIFAGRTLKIYELPD